MKILNQKVRIKNIIGVVAILVLSTIYTIYFDSINATIIKFIDDLPDLAKGGLITVVAYSIIHIVKSILEFIYTKCKQNIQFYEYKKLLLEYLNTVILLNEGGGIRIPYRNKETNLSDFKLLLATTTNSVTSDLKDCCVSVVLYYLNMKHHLSLGQKEKLYCFLRNLYPKLFIEEFVLLEESSQEGKKISLQLVSPNDNLVLNEWRNGVHLKSSSDFLLKDILREIENHSYDNYIKNFVEENYK